MRRARKPINQINVVPYIDVMLVLLVIFMVTAPLVAPGEIQLPSVGSKLTPAVNALRVILKADKSIELIDESAPTRTTVKSSLSAFVPQVLAIQAGRDQPVVIVADAG
ncbi:MAG TPA: biopolymer transporter ExbD, partial [Casimicrobiaceae bacterium]|nr:biopolymer transporter ExbD [Casimicrobiaceae bacterium]